MTDKKAKREKVMIIIGLILTALMIATSVILTSILSLSLNRFLSFENDLSEKEEERFNLEAYNALGL